MRRPERPGPRRRRDAALQELGPLALPPGSEGLRILAVGDSTMCSLYPGLLAAAARVGSPIDTAAVVGCGVASGETTTTRGEQVTPNSHRCPRLVDAALDRAFERIDPDVVVWMSVWEKSDLVVEAGTLRVGHPRRRRPRSSDAWTARSPGSPRAAPTSWS